MSDERYISEIEDRLRDAGAPPTPPDHLHGIARAEALGQADVVDIRSAVRPSSRFGRLVLAAAVLTASAAAALVIGVGGSGFHAERSINLQGVASASAVVDIGASSGPVRDVQMHVHGLPPAPKGAAGSRIVRPVFPLRVNSRSRAGTGLHPRPSSRTPYPGKPPDS